MRKLILIAIGVMILSLAVVGVASANNGPHGGYDNMTSACAGCHRAHTAQNEFLLVAETVYDLCVVCHGSTGGGANTNVVDGVFVGTRNTATNNQGTPGYRLNGGVFDTGATSRHDVDGLDGGDGVGTAWGSISADGLEGGVTGQLECTSCHDPHGSSNFRILKDYTVATSHSATNAQWLQTTNTFDPRLGIFENNLVKTASTDVTMGGTKGYTYVSEQIVDVYGISDPFAYAPADQTNSKMIKTSYAAGMSWFCTACHTAYGQTTHSQDQYAGDPNRGPYGPANMGDGLMTTRYSHKTYDTSGTARATGTAGHPAGNPLPFASGPSTNADWTTSTRGFFTCLSCHFAHGSTQSMSGFANAADFGEYNTGTGGVMPTNDSANLFWPNRGTCASCHWLDK